MRKKERLKQHEAIAKQRKKFLQLFAFLIALGAIVYFHYSKETKEQIGETNLPVYSYSYALRTYGNVLKDQYDKFEFAKKIAKDFVINKMMKDKFHEVQMRVGSIKAQTRIYEEMEKIKGGPVSFITPTIKELDDMVDKKIPGFKTQIITVANNMKAITDNYEMKRKIKADLVLTKAEVIAALSLNYGISFHPTNEEGAEKVKTYKKAWEIEKGETLKNNPALLIVSKALEKIADIFQKRDYLISQLLETSPPQDTIWTRAQTLDNFMLVETMRKRIYEEKYFGTQKSQKLVEEISALDLKISEEVKLGKSLYVLSETLDQIAEKDVNDFGMSEIYPHLEEQDMYGKLSDEVIKDIQVLRGRVNNLQFKFIK